MDLKLTLEILLKNARPYEIMNAMAELCYERRMNAVAAKDLPKSAYWSDQQALFEAATSVVRDNEIFFERKKLGIVHDKKQA